MMKTDRRYGNYIYGRIQKTTTIIISMLLLEAVAHRSKIGFVSSSFVETNRPRKQRRCMDIGRCKHHRKERRFDYQTYLGVSIQEQETEIIDSNLPKNWILSYYDSDTENNNAHVVYNAINKHHNNGRKRRRLFRLFSSRRDSANDKKGGYGANNICQNGHIYDISHDIDNSEEYVDRDSVGVIDSNSASEALEMRNDYVYDIGHDNDSSEECVVGDNVGVVESKSSSTKVLHTTRDVMICNDEIGNQEFYEMIVDFSQYGEREIFAVKDARLRAVLEGVVECSYEPAVYKAFEILYEDFLPIRVAGRFIFKRLKKIIDSAQQELAEEVHEINQLTGLSIVDIEDCRVTFLSIAQHHRDGGLFLTKQQMIQSGFLEEIRQQLQEYEISLDGKDHKYTGTVHDNDELFYLVANSNGYDTNNIKENRNKKEGKDNTKKKNDGHEQITFRQLMIGLHFLAQETCDVIDQDSNHNPDNSLHYHTKEYCDPVALLNFLLHRCHIIDDNNNAYAAAGLLDDKHKKFSDRYDEMVLSFRKWRQFVPSGKGRRLDVLRGCFIGAENEKIVNALKIVYVDYPALRIAGNTIFSLMSALIKKLSSQ